MKERMKKLLNDVMNVGDEKVRKMDNYNEILTMQNDI